MAMECTISDPWAAVGAIKLVQAFVCTYASSTTVVGLGLVVWFTISSMSYVRNQSLIMPIVFLLLIGSAALTTLPAVGLGVASIVLVGGGAAIALLVARRIDSP